MITNKTVFDRERPVFNEQSLAKMLPDEKMAWHLHHIFQGTIRHDPANRFENASKALNEALGVRRLIVHQFQPFEAIVGGICATCGIGRLARPPVGKYTEAIDEYYRILQQTIHACWICSYCFTVTFCVEVAQRQFQEDRKKLE